MADHYQQFSFKFGPLTEAEQVWLKQEVREREDPDTHDEETRFTASFDIQGDHAYFWADTSANLEEVAQLCQDFLAEFAPHKVISFEWSDSCSKPRTNEFGGGAVIITAESCTWTTTRQWIESHMHSTAPNRRLN